MAAAGDGQGPPQEPQVASSFPRPPHFYKLYSDGPSSGPPPPPPVTEPFDLFDRPFKLDEPLVPTAPNAMIRTEPDGSIDYRKQLQELVPELLPLFLELLRTLIEAPQGYAEPLSRVSSALAAAQHLINLIRQPQARATLEYVLELEVKDKEEALNKIRLQVQSLDQLLLESAQQLVDVSHGGGSSAAAAMDTG